MTTHDLKKKKKKKKEKKHSWHVKARKVIALYSTPTVLILDDRFSITLLSPNCMPLLLLFPPVALRQQAAARSHSHRPEDLRALCRIPSEQHLHGRHILLVPIVPTRPQSAQNDEKHDDEEHDDEDPLPRNGGEREATRNVGRVRLSGLFLGCSGCSGAAHVGQVGVV